MDSTDNSQKAPERIGNVLSIILLAALAALFLYAYVPRFMTTLGLS